MIEQTKTRFPAPLYAAAGAGDLAYQQLRKLPAVLTELSEKAAASLRTYNEQAGAKAAQLREKAQTTDYDALRGNAASVNRAAARGIRGRGRVPTDDIHARRRTARSTAVCGRPSVIRRESSCGERRHPISIPRFCGGSTSTCTATSTAAAS